MSKYLLMGKDKWIRVSHKDIRKIEKVDYPGAHKSCRYRIIITDNDNLREEFSYEFKENRDEKFDKILSMLEIEKENGNE